MHEVLLAAAFLCGEFGAEFEPGTSRRCVEHLLAYTNLPSHIHGVFIQNVLKLSSRLLAVYENSANYDELEALCDLLEGKLEEFVKSAELEVQERASTSLLIIGIVKEEMMRRRDEGDEDTSPLISDDMCTLFSGELNPVAPKAQKKVPLPDGLDLEVWINAPPSDSDSASDAEDVDDIFLPKHERQESRTGNTTEKSGRGSEPTQDEMVKMREARRQEQLNNPHYLKGSTTSKKLSYDSSEMPGISELSLSIPLRIGNEKRSDRYLNMDRQRRKAHGGNAGGSSVAKKNKKKGKTAKKERERDSSQSEELSDLGGEVTVNQSLELPEGATLSDDSMSSRGGALDDPHRALNIDLDTPLDDDIVTNNKIPKAEKSKKSKKHKKKTKTEKTGSKEPEVNLLGDVEPETIETVEIVERKGKKEKREKKEKKKDGKSSKTKKSKTGYEEAAGISTPSTEFQ